MSREDGLRLAAPFEHIVIEYPYSWAQGPDCVHVFNERTGQGQVYSPQWARALADGIRGAMGQQEPGCSR